MNVILAITGASGAIYARQSLELLLANPSVERIALICSENAEGVIAHEGVTLPENERIER